MKIGCATWDSWYSRYHKAFKRLEHPTSGARSTAALNAFKDQILHDNAGPVEKSIER